MVKDDYLYRNPDTAGTEMLFQVANLDPGTYNVTLFEGRTTDQSQVARLWVGDASSKAMSLRNRILEAFQGWALTVQTQKFPPDTCLRY